MERKLAAILAVDIVGYSAFERSHVKFFGCHKPNASQLDAVYADSRSFQDRSSGVFAPHGAVWPSSDGFAADLLRECGAPYNSGSTIETSLADHRGGSSPFVSTRTVIGSHVRRNNCRPHCVRWVIILLPQTSSLGIRLGCRSCICRRKRPDEASAWA